MVASTTHPGPQTKINRRVVRSPLVLLIASSILLLAFAFVRTNIALFPTLDAAEFPWKYEIIDVKAAVALLAGFLTLAYTRSQFALGLEPILNYRVEPKNESAYNLGVPDGKTNIIQVSLDNLGGGTGVVLSSQYSLKVKGEVVRPNLNYEEVVAQLLKLQLLISRDFELVNFSQGWSLGPKMERVIFEMDLSDHSKHENWRRVEQLDICLEFRSVLNDRYRKSIYCIPRLGIPQLEVRNSAGPSAVLS